MLLCASSVHLLGPWDFLSVCLFCLFSFCLYSYLFILLLILVIVLHFVLIVDWELYTFQLILKRKQIASDGGQRKEGDCAETKAEPTSASVTLAGVCKAISDRIRKMWA